MHVFDQDLQAREALKQTNGHINHQVTVSDLYGVANHPNGGYLMAVMASQMMDRSDKGTTPIITANFLSRPSSGPADIVTSVISQSRTFNRYEARLIQDEKESVRAIGSFVADDLECILDRYEEDPPEILPINECVEMPSLPGFSIFDTMDIRLEPNSAGWMKGHNGSKSEVRGWIRFREERPFDTCGIILAADAFFPPILVSQGLSGWVPTIEMSVNVRNMPGGKWLKGCFRTKHITCGLLDEDGELWDEDGKLVAISRQIAMFRG